MKISVRLRIDDGPSAEVTRVIVGPTVARVAGNAAEMALKVAFGLGTMLELPEHDVGGDVQTTEIPGEMLARMAVPGEGRRGN